jgi:hypothetical protein
VEVMMAGRAPSISRRRVIGAAAALPVLPLVPAVPAEPVQAPFPVASRSLWNRRLARYLRLVAEAKAVAETGWFREANDRYERETAAIVERFGSDESKEARRLRRAAFKRVSKAEDAYWRRCTDPMQKAAVALALTPVPHLAALAAKIAAIKAHQLHELDCMIRDCFEVLEEDVTRLSASAHPRERLACSRK